MTPRIYIACLAAYNNGKLHGRWVDCVDVDTVQEAIAAMLAESPEAGAEEWAVHDSEGFDGVAPGISSDVEELCKLGAAIEEHGEIIAKLHANLGGMDIDDTVSYFEENNAGEWPSLTAFAEHLLVETGELRAIPENLRNYFDFESYGRDLELGGDVFELDGFIFWNR